MSYKAVKKGRGQTCQNQSLCGKGLTLVHTHEHTQNTLSHSPDKNDPFLCISTKFPNHVPQISTPNKHPTLAVETSNGQRLKSSKTGSQHWITGLHKKLTTKGKLNWKFFIYFANPQWWKGASKWEEPRAFPVFLAYQRLLKMLSHKSVHVQATTPTLIIKPETSSRTSAPTELPWHPQLKKL